MHTVDPNIDAGRAGPIGGGPLEDYGSPSGPARRAQFYDMLALLGIGLPGQRIADLATGTGLLAREFAGRGASVDGVDIAEGQIATARAAG